MGAGSPDTTVYNSDSNPKLMKDAFYYNPNFKADPSRPIQAGAGSNFGSQVNPFSKANFTNGKTESMNNAGTFSAPKKGDYFGLGEKAYQFGPGKYDYYVGGEIDKKTGLQTLKQYALTDAGKPIVQEALAKQEASIDFNSGKAVELEQKRNAQQDIKRSRTSSKATSGARASKPAASGTLLTGSNQSSGTILGGSDAKNLLGM